MQDISLLDLLKKMRNDADDNTESTSGCNSDMIIGGVLPGRFLTLTLPEQQVTSPFSSDYNNEDNDYEDGIEATVILKENGLEFRLIAPGLDLDSVDLQFNQPETLRIKGQQLDIYSEEISWYEFSQAHIIHSDVPIDPNGKFEAVYDKGILYVTLPFVPNATVNIPIVLSSGVSMKLVEKVESPVELPAESTAVAA